MVTPSVRLSVAARRLADICRICQRPTAHNWQHAAAVVVKALLLLYAYGCVCECVCMATITTTTINVPGSQPGVAVAAVATVVAVVALACSCFYCWLTPICFGCCATRRSHWQRRWLWLWRWRWRWQWLWLWRASGQAIQSANFVRTMRTRRAS